ncbi:MAG: STAS domain-containing protein, partial [Kiritimatiellae bacterium]|nr:STAS domain-containing protein [Kiritimatiellia bacterium]
DVSNLNQFKKQMDPLFEEGESRHVLLDFEEMDRLSSKAIGLLSGYAKTARHKGKMLVFCQVNARVYNVLNLLGTISLFVMYESRESALTAINRGA